MEGRERGVGAEKERPLSTYINILPAFPFTTKGFFSLQKEVKRLIRFLINTYDKS